MVKNKNPEPENKELYTKLMATLPEIEIKGATMPYTSLNGNMFSYLKEGAVALRLAEKDRIDFIKKFDSHLFEAYGIVMKEYVTLTPSLLQNPKSLIPFVKKSYEYVKTLRAKPTKKK